METVRIIYSKEENVTFCMWKYFFDSCGVWVMPQDSNQNQEDDDRPKLYILSEKDKMQIKSDEMPQTVYLVSQELYNMLEPYEQKRSDIIVISWQKAQMRKNAQRAFLILTESNEESSDLYELYDIFLRYELWGMTWLFSVVIPKKTLEGYEKCIWDNRICDACARAIYDIEMKNMQNKYSAFAKIYYYYIEKSVEYRQNKEDRDEEMRNIFAMQKQYLFTYIKKHLANATAYFALNAEICKMGIGEKSTRLLFLKSIDSEDYTAGLLYLIAKDLELEIHHRNSEEAYKYYKKSYLLDKNYKALYEIARIYDKTGDWQGTLSLYVEVLAKVRQEKKCSCISISHIEYEYKVIGKISDIYYEKIKAFDMAKETQLSLKRLINNLNDRKEFDMILNCMFESKDDIIIYFNEIIYQIEQKIFSGSPCRHLLI